MPEINLLPTESAPSEATSKLVAKLKKLMVAELAVVLVIAAVGVGSYYLLSQRLEESLTAQNASKASIAALEATEQRLILLKDRIDKSRTVLASETAVATTTEFEELGASLPQGITLENTEITPAGIEVEYQAESSSAMSELLEGLRTSGQFQSVEVSSISYSLTTGYSLSLNLK